MTEPVPPPIDDFRLGEWLIQPSLNRISRGETTLTLELKVMQVLVCLAEHPGELVTRQDLIDTVWATEYISDNILTRAIAELRSALGDDAKEPTHIETIHRKGYRLVAPVEKSGAKGQRGDRKDAAVKRRWPHVLAIALSVVIGLLVILPPEALFERRADNATDGSPRIVVLPFENLGAPDDEYFADGVTEELISRLAAVSGLQVISRTSAMHYKDRNVPLQQIGEELDVGYVLEGAVRLDRNSTGSDRVRITPQLIDVADDHHLWNDSYDRVLEDIFAVQTDIAENVVAQLRATIHEVERHVVEAHPTENMEAYQAYLVGVHSFLKSRLRKDRMTALENFERAVDLDPGFAVAHAWLSMSHSNSYAHRYDFTDERLEKARASAETALKLEPGLPEGHRALGFYHYYGFRDYDKALTEFAIALEGLPNDTRLFSGITYVHRRRGHFDQALKTLAEWRRFDSWSYWQAGIEADTYIFVREYEMAELSMLRAIAIAPDRPDGYISGMRTYLRWDGATTRARQLLDSAPEGVLNTAFDLREMDRLDRRPESSLARLVEADGPPVWQTYFGCMYLFEMGDQSRAEAVCESALNRLEERIEKSPKSDSYLSYLGLTLARLGRRDEAVRAGEMASEMVPISYDWLTGTDRRIDLAKICGLVGESEKALDLIEELLSIPGLLSVGLLRLDPVWDPLRDDPRFQALLEKYDQR